MPLWATQFTPFGLMHALTLAWTLGALCVSIMLGRRWLREGRVAAERALAGAWGGFVVGVNLWSLVYWLEPARYDVRTSLPLQLCDLACLLAPLVFLAGWRWARTMVYFWGLTLSTQAFVTPILTTGPSDMAYWVFWLVHLSIVGSAAYDMTVRGYRPGVRDLGVAIGASLVYLGIVLSVNAWLDANYGYVGRSVPGNPTIVDRLGAWPLRVVWLVCIGILGMIVLWAIWPLGRMVARRAKTLSAR